LTSPVLEENRRQAAQQTATRRASAARELRRRCPDARTLVDALPDGRGVGKCLGAFGVWRTTILSPLA
jgi:hypothetical protein